MKTNKILIVSVGILVLLNVSLISMLLVGKRHHKHHGHHQKQHCERPHHKGKHGHGNRLEGKGMEKFLSHKLNLSEEQIQLVMKGKKEHMDFVHEKRDQLKTLNEQYFEKVANGNSDQKSEILKEIQAIHQEMMVDRYKHFEAMYALVDDDRKEELKRMLVRLSSSGPPHKPGRE